MSFFANNSQIPLVHNLVNYYMDLLKGLFFADDRQVHYLEAYCYKTDRRKSHRSFELYRRNMNHPEVITFDELYQRAKLIVEHPEN